MYYIQPQLIGAVMIIYAVEAILMPIRSVYHAER